MRHEGKLVGWVGLNRVGANVRCQPFDGRLSHRSVIPDGMDPNMPGLIIGRQQILALAVGSQESGPAVSGNRPDLCKSSGAVVDPPAGYPWRVALPDVKKCSVRAYRQ